MKTSSGIRAGMDVDNGTKTPTETRVTSGSSG
jgi:hypothetical protein